MAKPLTAEQKKQKAARDKVRRAKEQKAKSASKGTKPVGKRAEPSMEGRKLPGKRAITDLHKEVQTFMNRGAEQNAKGREKIGAAVKAIGLNAPAFAQARRQVAMGERDPNALRTYLDDLAYYAECLGVEKLAGDSLFDAREGAEDAAEPEEPTDTVVDFPQQQAG